MPTEPRIAAIAAVADNNVIGANNSLLWHIPADMQHFRALTVGHTVIMGRRTYESIGRALPRRRNIVVSATQQNFPDAEHADSLQAALSLARGDTTTFIIGGESIYRQALPFTQCLYLTRVHASPAGDTFFPPIDLATWRIVARSGVQRCEVSGVEFEFLEMNRGNDV